MKAQFIRVIVKAEDGQMEDLLIPFDSVACFVYQKDKTNIRVRIKKNYDIGASFTPKEIIFEINRAALVTKIDIL